ncbi:hypothetical protein E4T39_08725 [Aureobasidium subglaciale]|nr:hypothetical protein E4T39_08725 [Aureobasidium subglaciale]
MNSASQGILTRRQRRVACTECRQQKARCDAGSHPDQSCSRCRRFDVPCVVSNHFKRQHKHKKLSELEREAEGLRKRLETTETSDEHITAEYLPEQTLSAMRAPPAFVPSVLSIPLSSPSMPTPFPRSHLSTESSTKYKPTTRPANAILISSQSTEPTIARSLNGVSLTAEEVDDLFSIYFKAYAPALPILDPHTVPNTYHAQSKFLFWAIISVACRKAPFYLHLFSALAQSVSELAFLWPATTSKPIHGIQGSLLLLTWPFPRFANTLDVTYPLAGLLIHKAKQAGFHRSRASHEFYFGEGKAARLTDPEIAMRKDLWARCVYAYQSISIAKGHLPGRMSSSVSGYHTETSDHSLELQLKCQDIVVQCCIAVADNVLYGELSPNQSHAIYTIVRIFDTRLQDLEVENLTKMASQSPNGTFPISNLPVADKLHIQSARLNVQIFNLFIPSPRKLNDVDEPVRLLLSTARTVVDLIKKLVQLPSFPLSPPNLIIEALILASFTIIRVFKTGPSDPRDTEAEGCINDCKHLARALSSNANDALAKTAIMLEDLWKHPNTYRNPDGSADVPIPFLSRLSAGLVVDAASRWFDIINIPLEHGKSVFTEGTHITANATLRNLPADDGQYIDTSTGPSLATWDEYLSSLFNDDVFGDFNWVLSGDRSYT